MAKALEVCVDSIDGARTAATSGAARIEFCSALELGGLTPTLGSVRQILDLGIPVYALIRPRGGDFEYTRAEVRGMAFDIEQLVDAGVDGLVVGALDSNGDLDDVALKQLISACGGLPTTLHRAFDLARDLPTALERAIELGFQRILTSGGSHGVIQGLQVLQKLHALADETIQILPGGGVTLENLPTLVQALPVPEFHASCKAPIRSSARVQLGSQTDTNRYTTDADIVSSMVKMLNGYS